MGSAYQRIKNSKYKQKIKEFINMFTAQSQEWISKNIEPNARIIITGQHLPQLITNGTIKFKQYLQKFKGSLSFKEFQDARQINNIFQQYKIQCVYQDNFDKFKIYGEIWVTIKTSTIYSIKLCEEVKGASQIDAIHAQTKQLFKDLPKRYHNQPPKNQTIGYNSPQVVNYQKPTDWNAYYNAQTQLANAKLRQKLNREAIQWNNYARQKANRGW